MIKLDKVFNETIEEINQLTRQQALDEFRISECTPNTLVIQGAPFLHFGPQIEIEFHLPFFHILFQDWKVDRENPFILEVRDEIAESLNLTYRITQGNRLLKIANEDNIFCLIACESVSYQRIDRES